jgi:bifunctional UDP-N-acetylglucosamine pyrophosphorylase/glucosamine-1-phosphate N-acetyltransferase
MSSISVIILAAGLGTRMRSNMAKVLHRAGGATLLDHVVDAALGIAAPEAITAVVGHQAGRVRETMAPRGIPCQVQEGQHGTGHAVLSCLGLPRHASGRVVILYGDCPLLRAETLRGLLVRHEEAGCAATLITTRLDDPTGYGRILREGAHVAAIVEEKAATAEQKPLREINSGIYCFEADALWRHLPELVPNPASGEYYLTDMVEILCAHGLATAPFEVGDPTEILGINTRVELAEADRLLRERKARELMLAGVTIERPETVLIDKPVEVGRDTLIGPFSQLLGATRVGENCVIGSCAILRNATLEDEAVVHPFTSIDDSTLERGAQVGPYARLRLGARVEAGAHAGNFVELKKTRLGSGSKAMHLAYLGDTTIGQDVNIGAGTITCNYDGRQKHPTQIGDGAFVGSNATLVAPLEIGAGSYIGAGSVITDAVPADALALGRTRQVVKEGWAQRRREKGE